MDRATLATLSLPERFAALVRHRTMPMLPPLDPAALLATLAVPFLRLTRPRDLSTLDTGVDALLDEIGLRPANPSGRPAAAAPSSGD